MMQFISRKHDRQNFSICPENFTGEKGKGGMSIDGASADCARELGQGWKVSPLVRIEPGEVFTMAEFSATGAIKHIWLTFSAPNARDLILRIYWDGNEKPSVEVPVGDFFASANPLEYRQISSLAVCVNPKLGLNAYWEMPFRTGFKMTLENRNPKQVTLYYQIDGEHRAVGEDELYFHAQFRRVNPLPTRKYIPSWTMLSETASMLVHICTGVSTTPDGGAKVRLSSISMAIRNSRLSAVLVRKIISVVPIILMLMALMWNIPRLTADCQR